MARKADAGRSRYASSRSTISTSRSQTASHSASSGASTITRTSGSVPEGRTSTRPRPSSFAFSSSTAAQTSAPSIAPRSAVGCSRDAGAGARRARRPPAGVAERPQSEKGGGDAVARRGEVGPDDVARLLAPERPVALEQLLDHVAVADLRLDDLDTRLLHRGHESEVGHHGHRHPALELARSCRSRAISAIRSSPSCSRPSPSTARTRSPSPS